MIIVSPFPEELLPTMWEWMRDYSAQMVDDYTPQDYGQMQAKYASDMTRGAKSYLVMCGEAPVGAVWAEPIADGMYIGHLVFARHVLPRADRLQAARRAIDTMLADGVRKIIWQSFPNNKAFLRFLGSLGAVVEGTLRENTRKNGELRDIVLLASFRGKP